MQKLQIKFLTAPVLNFTPVELKRGVPLVDDDSDAKGWIARRGNNSRTITGIAAVIGNIDSVNDRIMPNAFANTIAAFRNGNSRVRHLWQHNASEPPVATITGLKELTRAELPDEMRRLYPEATGGLQVTRKYYRDEFSDRLYQAVRSGGITEMSFGFVPVGTNEVKDQKGETIRELLDVQVFDTSDVNWGANPATISNFPKGGKAAFIQPVSRQLIPDLSEAVLRRRLDHQWQASRRSPAMALLNHHRLEELRKTVRG